MRLCCLVIALAFLAANSSDSWGRSKKHPSRNEATKTEQSAKSDQRGTPNQPLSVNVVPTDEQKEDAKKKDAEAIVKAADDRKSVEYAGYQVLIGVVTFFIFVLQLIAFSLQAAYMRRTVVEMRRTTHATIRAARATQKSAEAALRQANAMVAVEGPIAAVGQLKLLAYENEHSSVPVTDPVPGGVPPPFCRAAILIQNRGRTEMTIHSVFCDWVVTPTIEEKPEYHFEERWNGAITKETTVWFVSQNAIRLNQIDAETIDNFGQFLWVYGKIVYSDFMGDRYELGYIARWVTSQGFIRDPLANYEYKRKI